MAKATKTEAGFRWVRRLEADKHGYRSWTIAYVFGTSSREYAGHVQCWNENQHEPLALFELGEYLGFEPTKRWQKQQLRRILNAPVEATCRFGKS